MLFCLELCCYRLILLWDLSPNAEIDGGDLMNSEQLCQVRDTGRS